MMKHFTRYVLAFYFALTTGLLWSQNPTDSTVTYLDYSLGTRTYEIGAVEVEGTQNRDENAIRSIAGLQVGQQITVPSDRITDGVKALYKLRLFENVEIVQDRVEGDVIFLKIVLHERPTLSRYSFTGTKKSQEDDLSEIIDGIMNRGGIVTINSKELAKEKVTDYFVDKGFFDATVGISEFADSSRANSVQLIFEVSRNDKVKIAHINFEGNEVIKDKKLKRLMKGTKKKGTFLRKSKYVADKFEEDKERIIEHYNKLGYRDAEILSDSVWRDDEGLLNVDVSLYEGNQYYFRNILWKGNSIYDDQQLSTVLGINKGDIYDRELLERRISFSLDGRDISSLYLDQGYLFFDLQPTEIAIVNDSIDIEMRINEGAQATIDKVTIMGNDRTNENVIRRELRTRPGEKFSRSDIIRSQRQIINLGYFNPETLEINTPVNANRGTVDIEYTVEETPSDQLELSAGYGGFSGLIGTLGVTFNNFSIQNIGKRETWNPLPQGDGQRLSLRIQSNSRFYKSYNFSFTEPWLGGKKPNSFTLGTAYSSFSNAAFGGGSLSITRGFVGLGTQLKFPDDFFVSNTVLNIENIVLDEYSTSQFLVSNGNFRNFNIKQTFSRSSVSEPIYPRRGNRVSLTIQFTPPYSLFRKDNYWLMTEREKEDAIGAENLTRGIRNQLSPQEEIDLINDLEEARKFDWLEYHKWRFDAEWYFNIVGKLVMMTSFKMGYLGAYNSTIGISPFERFEYGGDGLSNQTVGITGKDIISARGYPLESFPISRQGGGTIFNKYTLEVRYPLSLNPSSSIYLHGFLQGGNIWSSFREFNPFDLKRSAGVGVRIFLPMFGLLGFDYGFGFDRDLGQNAAWSEYGRFSIILGFEPD